MKFEIFFKKRFKIFLNMLVDLPFPVQGITRRQGGGSAGVYIDTLKKPTPQAKPTKLAEDRMRIPQGSAVTNHKFTLPVITACKVVTYNRNGTNIS
jgi:hypothetical protein